MSANKEKTSPGGVQAVERAFALLEALAASDTPLPLATLAATVGLPQATTHRLLRTMHSSGYVQQLENRNYALDTALIRLGGRATPQLAERAAAGLASLEALAEETANLAILDGDYVRYIAQVPSRHRMRMFTEVGRSVLPHASGVGKAMLAELPEARVREIIRRTGLPRYTATTITSVDAFIRDLRATRARGFAIDDGEQEVGVRCIAVAVPRPQNQTGGMLLRQPAAVSISGPSSRFTDELVTRAVSELRRVAAGLAAEY